MIVVGKGTPKDESRGSDLPRMKILRGNEGWVLLWVLYLAQLGSAIAPWGIQHSDFENGAQHRGLQMDTDCDYAHHDRALRVIDKAATGQMALCRW